MSPNHHKFKNSSSIEHCDYHDDTETMELKFISGAVYHYPNCHKDHYHAIKASESPGKYFHQSVRSMKSVKVK